MQRPFKSRFSFHATMTDRAPITRPCCALCSCVVAGQVNSTTTSTRPAMRKGSSFSSFFIFFRSLCFSVVLFLSLWLSLDREPEPSFRLSCPPRAMSRPIGLLPARVGTRSLAVEPAALAAQEIEEKAFERGPRPLAVFACGWNSGLLCVSPHLRGEFSSDKHASQQQVIISARPLAR